MNKHLTKLNIKFTFSTTATFRTFHKNSSIDTQNAHTNPEIRTMNTPPTFAIPSSFDGCSDKVLCCEHQSYTFLNSKIKYELSAKIMIAW